MKVFHKSHNFQIELPIISQLSGEGVGRSNEIKR